VKKIEVQNFQNLTVENATIATHPLTQGKEVKKDLLTIVFVRDPYAYFDYLLFDYLKHKRSLLFTQDIISNMKTLDNESFLKWLKTLNFIPFYNPQTSQLDARKRLDVAIENLESFDYVVPYEEIDVFLENVSLDINIYKEETKSFFSLSTQHDNEIISTFIGNDLKLYERSLELWELVKKNNFNPLVTLIEHKQKPESIEDQKKKLTMHKYKGIAGQITSKSIKGWVFHTEKEEYVMLEVYNNDTLLCTLTADKIRQDLKKRQLHPTGKCGFEITFDKLTFREGDKVEIKILPENITLPFGPNIRSFLEISD